jgi:RAB protein geranylgeranyltransferase component A
MSTSQSYQNLQRTNQQNDSMGILLADMDQPATDAHSRIFRYVRKHGASIC